MPSHLHTPKPALLSAWLVTESEGGHSNRDRRVAQSSASDVIARAQQGLLAAFNVCIDSVSALLHSEW